jgi:hypothetical protein
MEVEGSFDNKVIVVVYEYDLLNGGSDAFFVLLEELSYATVTS